MVDSEFDLIHLKRVLKVCIFVNKMFKFGKSDDFVMKQIKDGEEVINEAKKEYAAAQVQVDVEELKQNGADPNSAGPAASSIVEPPTSKVLKLLKNHAIDMVTRMNPQNRNYYKMVWESTTLQELLETKLDAVFKDKEREKVDRVGAGITFRKYLEYILKYIHY